LEACCLETVSRSPEETQDIGRVLGEQARPGHVYLLKGRLGAGKTCLTQGVLWGLGGDEFARSPTFVLATQYRGRLILNHVDLYRIGSVTDLDELGLDEILEGDGVCIVEWADRAPELFREQHLEVQIDYLAEAERRITLSAHGPEYDRLVDAVGAALAARPTSA